MSDDLFESAHAVGLQTEFGVQSERRPYHGVQKDELSHHDERVRRIEAALIKHLARHQSVWAARDVETATRKLYSNKIPTPRPMNARPDTKAMVTKRILKAVEMRCNTRLSRFQETAQKMREVLGGSPKTKKEMDIMKQNKKISL